MKYVTNIGPTVGTVQYNEVPFSLGIYEDIKAAPIGTAVGAGYDGQRRQLWRLAVRGERLPGKWLVVDRAFVEAEG